MLSERGVDAQWVVDVLLAGACASRDCSVPIPIKGFTVLMLFAAVLFGVE